MLRAVVVLPVARLAAALPTLTARDACAAEPAIVPEPELESEPELEPELEPAPDLEPLALALADDESKFATEPGVADGCAALERDGRNTSSTWRKLAMPENTFWQMPQRTMPRRDANCSGATRKLVLHLGQVVARAITQL